MCGMQPYCHPECWCLHTHDCSCGCGCRVSWTTVLAGQEVGPCLRRRPKVYIRGRRRLGRAPGHKQTPLRGSRRNGADQASSPGRAGAQGHGHHRGQLRRRQLLHVRARVQPALPVHLAQRPHLRHGRRAGRRRAGAGWGGYACHLIRQYGRPAGMPAGPREAERCQLLRPCMRPCSAWGVCGAYPACEAGAWR